MPRPGPPRQERQRVLAVANGPRFADFPRRVSPRRRLTKGHVSGQRVDFLPNVARAGIEHPSRAKPRARSCPPTDYAPGYRAAPGLCCDMSAPSRRGLQTARRKEVERCMRIHGSVGIPLPPSPLSGNCPPPRACCVDVLALARRPAGPPRPRAGTPQPRLEPSEKGQASRRP